MGDSSSSDGDGQPRSLTTASALGIKGPLRFRLHHSSQKAHVVLRRVEISDDSGNNRKSKSLLYFSLFAQKRIEVKPGKEILVALPSVDGRLKDRAILFEGDVPDEESTDDEQVAKLLKKGSFANFPEGQVVPPKLRRTWSSRMEMSPGVRKSIRSSYSPVIATSNLQASLAPSPAPTTFSAFSRPTYASVAVQVDPPSPPPHVLTSDQVNISKPCTRTSSGSQTVHATDIVTTNVQTEQQPMPDCVPIHSDIIQDVKNISIMQRTEETSERERSLSPMDLDSPPSTPPQSPVVSPMHGLRISSTQSTVHSNQSSGTLVEDISPVLSPTRMQSLRISAPSSSSPISHVSQSPIPAPRSPSKPSHRPMDKIPKFTNVHGNILSEDRSGAAKDLNQMGKETTVKSTARSKGQTWSGSPGSSHSSTVTSTLVPKPSTQPSKTRASNSFVSGGFVTEFVNGSSGNRQGVKEGFSLEAAPTSVDLSHRAASLPGIERSTPSAPQITSRLSAQLLPPPPPPTELDSSTSPPLLTGPNPLDNLMAFKGNIPLKRSTSDDSIASSSASAKEPHEMPPRHPGSIHPQPLSSSFTTSSNAHHRVASIPPVTAFSPQLPPRSKPPVPLPPTPQSSQRTPPPDVKSLAYISSGPTSNPLSIKPSVVPRHITSAPSVDKSVAPKKTLKVGTRWPHNRQNGQSDGSISKDRTKVLSIHSSESSVDTPMSISSSPSPSSELPSKPTELPKMVSYASPQEPQEKNWKPVKEEISNSSAYSSDGRFVNGKPVALSTTYSTSPISPNSVASANPPSMKIPMLVPSIPSLRPSYDSTNKPLKSENSDEHFPPRAQSQLQSGVSYNPLPVKRSATPTAPSALRNLSPPNQPLPPKPVHPSESSSKFGQKGSKRTASPSSYERPKKRTFKWPTIDSLDSIRLTGDGDLGITKIAFNSDGSQFAICCHDHTVRVWNNSNRSEMARLLHSSPVVSAEWMESEGGVVSLADDGVVSKWTKSGQNKWQWTKILDAGNDRRTEDDMICLAYVRDRIAVAFPRIGVKVWLWVKGTWQPQRSILRQNVTSIKFVEDGEALLGGTRDGVLWYCQVPNGTLKAYAFLKSKIYSIDVTPSGTHALVAHASGRSHLVGIKKDDGKGQVEQVYSTNETTGEYPGAAFASHGQAILFGCGEGCVLVWDKRGDVVCGLDHGDEEVVQAMSSFDRAKFSRDRTIVTGTQKGLLTWWPQPDSQLDHPPEPESTRSKIM